MILNWFWRILQGGRSSAPLPPTIIQDTPVALKLYTPETLVKSGDRTLDDDVLDGIREDIALVDGAHEMRVIRFVGDGNVNFDNGEVLHPERSYIYGVGLTRQLSNRDNRAVKQLRLFMQAVQNDDLSTIDTIIELPRRTDIDGDIRSGDFIEDTVTNIRYKVIGVDHSTLDTRIRIGARRFK